MMNGVTTDNLSNSADTQIPNFNEQTPNFNNQNSVTTGVQNPDTSSQNTVNTNYNGLNNGNFNGGNNLNFGSTPVMHPAWSNGALARKPKPCYEIKRKDIIFAVAFFLISLIGIPLTLWGGFRGGFTFFFASSFACLTLYLYSKGNTPDFFGLLCGILSLAGSGVFICSVNPTVKFFLLIFMCITSAVYFISLSGSPLGTSDGELFFGTGNFFVSAVSEIPLALRSFFSGKNAGKIRKILIGCLCALPLLVTVIPLLQSADLPFENLLTEIASSCGTYIFKFICGTLFALCTVSLALALKKDTVKPKEIKLSKAKENIYLISFLGITCAVYLIFLFSHFAYVTDAFRSVLPKGFTASDYARRGFLQMCTVAGINLVLIYTVTHFMNGESKSASVIKGECLFIGIFTLFIISSAITKTAIYVQRFALTQLRLFSAVFAVFTAIAVLAVLFKIFFKKVAVFRICAVTGILLLTVLGFADVNTVIANNNVDGYISGKLSSVDVEYLERLDLSAVPALIRLENECNIKRDHTYAMNARQSLKNLRYKYFGENSVSREAGSFNRAEYKGLKLLEEFFSKNTD